jgi:hypothetical protein
MCASAGGIASGEHVYRALVAARQSGKHVYLLASHSHYFLENLYGTAYWKDPAHGGEVLPGWIVGTAGAVRYPLPAEVQAGPGARSHVYGYLSGEVDRDGRIAFTYRQLERTDLARTMPPDYTAADVDFCFDENPRLDEMGRSPPAPSCLVEDQGH